jgi:hypothetical protein
MLVASRKLRALRVLVALVLCVGTIVGVGVQANAGIVPGVVCNALASLQITGGPGAWNWNFVAGSGNCIGDGDGPYVLTGEGKGTSSSLGFCDGLLVQNLDLDVTWHLTSLKDLSSFDRSENWLAPLSTFPIVTPFLVRDPADGALLGAGAILNRFGGACPPAGRPQSVTIELRLT